MTTEWQWPDGGVPILFLSSENQYIPACTSAEYRGRLICLFLNRSIPQPSWPCCGVSESSPLLAGWHIMALTSLPTLNLLNAWPQQKHRIWMHIQIGVIKSRRVSQNYHVTFLTKLSAQDLEYLHLHLELCFACAQ